MEVYINKALWISAWEKCIGKKACVFDGTCYMNMWCFRVCACF